MAGHAGKILKVDLGHEKIVKEITPRDLKENYIGGAGFGAYFLYHLVPPEVKEDPDKNWVMISVGPLCGTIAPSSARTTVTTLSPVTGIYADSNVGGDFGPELKYAGYDAVLITGRAKRPVYLWINNEEVEIRDAGHLVGKTTWEADDYIRKEVGDWRIKTALVGPAAQKGLLYGCLIINKFRAAGKTGVGSALAQKNLIGLAVRGTKGISIYDPSSFEACCEKILSFMRNSEGWDHYGTYGTQGLIDVYQRTGRLPVKNRQEVAPDEILKNISGDVFVKNLKVRDRACFNCALHCSHWFKIKNGRYAGEQGEKPELVTAIAFGPLLGSYDYGTICHYQNEGNRYGIDLMECGNTLALAFEAYQRGLITTKETDGIALEWGNLDSIEKAFEKIANFEGIGKILGLGVKRTAAWIGKGADRFAIEVKGYGMSLAGIRNAPHWGLAFAVASRGGDHLKALPTVVAHAPEMVKDLFGEQPENEIMQPLEIKGKGKMVAWFENYLAVLDSLGVCKLAFRIPCAHPFDLAPALSYATGISYDFKKLIECGERIYNVEKAFNARLGLTRKDDTLPRRFMEEPAPAGPRKGQHMGTVLPQLLDDYYEARGWDKKTGLPTRTKLESLGLKEIADDLAERGKLADL